MARSQDRKRHRADEPSHQDNSPMCDGKRQRTDKCLHRDNHPVTEPRLAAEDHHRWQYPPEFWDRLSKIPLIHSAVDELERRTHDRPPCPSPPRGVIENLQAFGTAELDRFARHGGPDLRDLRGFPPPTNNHRPVGAMSSSSRSRAAKSTNPTTLPTTSGTTTTKKSTTPYNRGFEQHLTDHGVHPIYSSQEPDLEDLMTAIAIPRASLSPSQFSNSAFKTFQENNFRAKDEEDVLADVIPIITGPRQANHPSSRKTTFRNLEPLTDGTVASAKPDIYYGAYPEDLDRPIRDNLARYIIPSTMEDRPMAPNFFLEVKGPDDSLAVAIRQARYDGALGARAINALQNYGKEEPEYDGNAYTFSSTYYDGTLKLYTHHTTAPTTTEGRPEYHMSQAGAYAMTHTRETFVQGTTAFRNARDLAKRHRDGFIEGANARASQVVYAVEPNEDEISALDKPVDPAHHIALQDADNELQQQIAETSFYDFDDDGDDGDDDDGGHESLAVPRYPYTEDDSHEASQEPAASGDDPSMSFTSSFTSGFSADQSRAKRLRQSLSPGSESTRSQALKSRTRPSAARRSGLVQPGSSDSHWVGTYWCKGMVCFRDLEGSEVKTELKHWTEQIVDNHVCYYWQDFESGSTFWATKLPRETKKSVHD